MEDRARQRAQILHAPTATEQQRECAVFLRARRSREALREFALEREDHRAHGTWLCAEAEEDLARNVVRQIPEHLCRSALEEVAHVELRGVAMHDGEFRKTVSEILHKPIVL